MRSYLERKELVVESIRIATDRSRSGKQCIMVLFPNADWTKDVMDYLSQTIVGTFVAGMPIRNVFIRYSDNRTGLKSLPVDCLILVDPDNPDFNVEGVAYAKARLQSQQNSLTIEVKTALPVVEEENPGPSDKGCIVKGCTDDVHRSPVAKDEGWNSNGYGDSYQR